MAQLSQVYQIVFAAFVYFTTIGTLASHFRYATYNWKRISGRTVEFYTEQSRRWSYPLYPYKQVGESMDISSEDSNLRWLWGDGQVSNHVIIISSFDSIEDWAVGSQTLQHTYANIGTYTIRMYSCCRIGTLAEGNAHGWYQTEIQVNTDFAVAPTRSIRATSPPIIFAEGGKAAPIQLPYVLSDSTLSTSFSYTTPGGGYGQAGTSGLAQRAPGYPSGMQLDASTGLITWTPPVPSGAYTLYAVQFTMTDGWNRMALDVLFKVGEATANANPVFQPAAAPTIDMFIGLEVRFTVVAHDADAGDHPSIVSGVLPSGAVLDTGCKEGSVGQLCSREFRWTPALGQGAVDVCFTAHDNNGGSSQGLYCVRIREGAAQLLFLTGIIRDFKKTQPDFYVAYAADGAFVQSAVGVDGKPVYNATASTGTTSGIVNFKRWWNTDAAYSKQIVHSITLTNAATVDKRIFSYETTTFHPIDGILWGNENDDHNRYFTYEIHSDITYTEEGGEKFHYKTSDDMWVFINGQLVADLHGIHNTPAEADVAMDDIAGLVKGETYRVDIFYAHRGIASTPTWTLQINEAAVCNALSTGVQEVNFGKVTGFTGAAVASVKPQGQAANPAAGLQGSVLRLVASSISGSSAVWFSEDIASNTVGKVIKFLNGFRAEFGFKVTHTSGAEGFAFVLQAASDVERGDAGGKLGYDGITRSFAIEFDMNHDATQQATYGDPNRQHVSIHTRNSNDENSAQETYSVGITSAQAFPLAFTNNTEHHVVIEYVPANDDNSGGPLLGWVRVFLNGQAVNPDKDVQVVPFVQAQVDGRVLRTMFPGNGGYVGFTSASTSLAPNNIDITYWTFMSVPLSAAATNAVQSPTDVVAGATGSFSVQARDACGNKIQIGGQGSQFVASLGPDTNVAQEYGPPSPAVAVTTIDNDNGIYTFTYSPMVAAAVKLTVTLDGVAIQGSPWSFQVTAGATSAAASRCIVGHQLVESYSNCPSTSDGIWTVTFAADGTVLNSTHFATGDMTDVDTMVTTLNAYTGRVAMVVRGSAWTTFPTGHGVEAAFSRFGCNLMTSANVIDKTSYACIGVHPTTTFTAIQERNQTERTSLLSVQQGTGDATYILEARSAAAGTGQQAYIQSYPKVLTLKAANDEVPLTIMAVDAFGNLKNSPVFDPFTMSFDPAMTETQQLTLSHGFYAAKFKQTSAQTYSVNVRLTVDLPSSPYTVKIVGGVADADKTTLTGSNIYQGTSNVQGSFDVHLTDAYDNKVTIDSNTVSVELVATTPSAITVAASTTGWSAGTESYPFTYTATVATTYTIKVTVNQVVAEPPSPWQLVISAGTVVASHCTYVSVPSTTAAGVVQQFTIQEFDAFDNKVATGVEPTIEVTGIVDGVPVVSALGGGLYSFSFAMSAVCAGTCAIKVKVGGTAIADTFASAFTVTAGALSTASAIINTASTAVDTNMFTIRAKDQYGNARTAGGDQAAFTVDIRSASNVAAYSILVTAPSVSEDYTVTWRSNVSTTYIVSVAVAGSPIVGSGSTVTLVSGVTAFDATISNGPGLVGGVQLTSTSFTIQARDRFGNNRHVTTDTWTLDVTPADTGIAATTGTVTPSASVTGGYDAVYNVPAHSTEFPTYTLTLTLTTGTTGTVFSKTAHISPTAQQTCATPSAISSMVAGGQTQFDLTEGCCPAEPGCTPATGKDYRVELLGVNGSATGTYVCQRTDSVSDANSACLVNNNANPYVVTLRSALKAGVYSVRIYLDGLHEINSTAGISPPTVTVTPAAVNGAKCVAVGFPATMVAGTTKNYTVELRDSFDNMITSGTHSVFLDTNGQALSSAAATKRPADGRYIGYYTTNTPTGSRNPRIEVDGSDVGNPGQRYAIDVTHSVPDASKAVVTSSIFSLPITVGDTFTVHVVVKDTHGNIHTSGTGVTVLATLTNAANQPVTVSPAFTVIWEALYQRYRLVGRTTVSGIGHKLSITVNGVAAAGSPFLFTVLAGQISEANTQQAVGLAASVTAGTTVVYTVYARDSYNNSWTGSTVTVKASSAVTTYDTTTAYQSVGVFTVTFSHATLVGTHTYRMTAGGIPLGNPPTNMVTHGPAYGGSTRVLGAIPAARIDEVHTVTFSAFDVHNNAITTGASPSSYALNFTRGYESCDTDNDNGGGQAAGTVANAKFTYTVQFTAPDKYAVSFNGTEIGDFNLHFAVAGTHMACANVPQLTLGPGAVVAATSTISGDGLVGGTAGTALSIKIVLRDRFNNRVSSSANVTIAIVSGGVPSVRYLLPAEVAGGTIDSYFVPYQPISGEEAHWLVAYTAGNQGEFEFYATLNGGHLTLPSPTDKIVVTPGAVADFVATFKGDDVATRTSHVEVVGTDAYANKVDDNGASLYTLVGTHATFADPQYKFYGARTYLGNGTYRFAYRPTFAGSYSVLIAVPFGETTKLHSYTRSMSPALCGDISAATPYRCPNDTCVADIATCTSLFPVCPVGEVQCPVTEVTENAVCVATSLACPCPSGYTRCASGHCDKQCLQPTLCPSDYPVQCLRGGELVACRKTAVDCPTELACPTNYYTCDGGLTCGTTRVNASCLAIAGKVAADCYYSTCITVLTTECPDGQSMCASGQCVTTLQDCPTQVSCPANEVLCWDGSCRATANTCPEMAFCLDADNKPTTPCPDGTCRTDLSQCPLQVTCPPGWVKCENGRCLETVDECYNPALNNGTVPVVTCAVDQVRCADGRCVENSLMCESQLACTSGAPVLCSNGECVSSVSACPQPVTCHASLLKCAYTELCVADLATECPTGVTCSESQPVLCPDKAQCVADVTDCVTLEPCSYNLPIRCADGSCRSSLSDCPSTSVCPTSTPTRCADGHCARSVDTCYGSNTNETLISACESSQVRCADGSCAGAWTLCPSTVTCGTGTTRCEDGQCKTSCGVNTFSCASGQILCPQSDYGLLCAANLTDCPQGIVCPAATPVRCADTSCRATQSQCTQIVVSPTTTKVLCPDGGWEAEKDQCGTQVTCPQCAPYKCWDDTCRIFPFDCPPMPLCPPDQSHACPDGSCVSLPTSCRSVSSQCDSTTPVMCPDNTCVASAANCSCPYFPTDGVNNEIFCANGMTRCHDGSCKKRSSTCGKKLCPPHLPTRCLDGMCAHNRDQCLDLDTGCPPERPLSCSGACVKSGAVDGTSFACQLVNFYLAVNSPCPTNEVRCPDGSCAGAVNQCPQSNRCFKGYMRCHDKRCVRRPKDISVYNPCIEGTSGANMCPASRPVRCDQGFCSSSSIRCPPPLTLTSAQFPCPRARPVRCSDGSCHRSGDSCPLVYPCSADTGTTRCSDGSCRAVIDECPVYDSTACNLADNLCCPYRHTRCDNGLCAVLPDNCDDNGKACANPRVNCFNVTTGCPGAQQRCEGAGRTAGLCVNNVANDCFASSPTRPASGCAALNGTVSSWTKYPLKCEFTGACVESLENCTHPETLCPHATPVRCLDGSCKAQWQLCNATASCPTTKITCADNACVDNLYECTTRRGCPVDEPIRCHDGSCRAVAAGTAETLAEACLPVVVCNAGETLCNDGSCAAKPKFCPSSVPHPTCTGDKPLICVDGVTCVHTRDECPGVGVCPPTMPVTCPDGTCRSRRTDCQPAPNKCNAATHVACFDGRCVDKADASLCSFYRTLLGVDVDQRTYYQVNGDAVCGGNGRALCLDSTCAARRRACPVLAACEIGQQRCDDGSCRTVGGCASAIQCSSGNSRRCADGVCRFACPDYDGCAPGLKMCANGFCVGTGSGCGTPATAPEYAHWPCYGEACARYARVTPMVYSLSEVTSVVIDVAITGSTVEAQVTVPSGSIIRDSGVNIQNTIQFFPVGESRLMGVVNRVNEHRVYELRTNKYMVSADDTLPYQSTVLSAAFACVVDSAVVQPFQVPMTYAARMDTTLAQSYADVCLASIVGKTGGVDEWECVHGTEARRARSLHQAGTSDNWVNSTFSVCSESTIYAFVFSPLEPVLADETKSDNWFKNNWYIMFPSIIGGGLFIAGMWVLFARWWSFRKRLHTLRVQRDLMKEKVNDAEEFGVREDSDMIMLRNPLGQHIGNMKGVMSTNVDEVEMMETNQMRHDYADEVAAQEQEIQLYQNQLDQLRQEVQFNRPRGGTDDNMAGPALSPQNTFFNPPPLVQQSSSSSTAATSSAPQQNTAAFSSRPKKRNL